VAIARISGLVSLDNSHYVGSIPFVVLLLLLISFVHMQQEPFVSWAGLGAFVTKVRQREFTSFVT